MMTRPRRVAGLVSACVLVVFSAPAFAQESKSAALARELATLLDQAKLDSMAAQMSDAPEAFAAALYFPGSELLVVSAKYSAPTLMVEKIGKKDYRDVYMDLNGAPLPNSKIFLEDLSADGLRARPDQGQPFDTYESSTIRVAFDGDWKKQKISEDDYMKAFADADENYSKIISALLTALKKTS